MNSIKALQNFNQSVWLDYIRRGLITSGELVRLVEEDGLKGVTSNPSIFQKAISGSTDYTDFLEDLRTQKELDAKELYEQLAIRDIRDAADVMKKVYEETNGRDGYVSLEVSPYLAHDTKGTIDEARRLWHSVSRKNLMIKVPATKEGIPAIEQLIAGGINVNVTLIFSLEAYEDVAEAYIRGLEKCDVLGGDVHKIASVASFFVSRIDAAIEAKVGAQLKTASTREEKKLLRSVLGKVAIANAKIAYQRYKKIFQGDRWKSLEDKGAKTQRVLWASTSTKNPKYSDVLYVEELIGPETVNTIPPSTYESFRDHGRLRGSLEEDIESATHTMKALSKSGISMKDVTDKLLDEGVRLFSQAFDALLNAVDTTCRDASHVKVNTQNYILPKDLTSQVKSTLKEWQTGGKVRRLFTRDPSLWTGADEGQWLGWLGITEDQMAHGQHLNDIAEEVKREAFSHVLLLGMGGSSLCPYVLRKTFGKVTGYPELHVLDSTDPAQIKSIEDKIDPSTTLFIISSKSGGTLEPNIFKKHFFALTKGVVGSDKVGNRFIAITDPGSNLQRMAEKEGFRHIFYGIPSIGGRYSALSDFGMVPAAIMGIDALKFLDRADEMAIACSPCLPAEDNPGVVLGTILGVLGNNGRDKVTLVISPSISDLGAWLEQLLAESTGKEGKALIPVDREKIGTPDVYGYDRLFVYLRCESAPDNSQDEAIKALEMDGQPVVRISLADSYDLGQEFFRWEIATAVAGSIMGINPFNQPDVETSKIETKKLTDEYEEKGSLPQETSILKEEGIQLFTDERNSASIGRSAGKEKTVSGYLRAHLNRIEPGDYLALLAYIEMNEENEEILQGIRLAIREKKGVATCLGFGPRFLHSTGQAYKGGPNSGVFLQITCEDSRDLAVPGQKYTFGIVKAAQARGDFQVLVERNRRALRVHLGSDVKGELKKLEKLVNQALS